MSCLCVTKCVTILLPKHATQDGKNQMRIRNSAVTVPAINFVCGWHFADCDVYARPM